MDASTKSRIQITGLVVVCLVAWYTTLVFRGHFLPVEATLGNHFAGFTSAISAGAFAAVAFTKWLWKLSFLRPWLSDVPLVAGRWHGHVHRKYKDGQVNEAQIEVDVLIEQPTMSVIRFVQTMKDQSAEGHTEACQLYRAADGKFYLQGLYQITKTEEHKETNGKRQIYYGAMRLQLDYELNPDVLSGSYWSDEFTRGRVTLTRKGST